ncbi:MAG: ATP-dependent helicase, partial [Coriobacteriales bacterium]|nr:ATP-dependent helicase [Coriobacteriales bacterium]
MTMDTRELQEAFAKLNDKQRQAVETLDGPVMVVAGPGTGKTQLLSLRAANILRQRDVGPDKLLCLTFTDAGAEAMTRRLVSFLGREAYGITVATFHSFASSLRSDYPQYFRRSAQAVPITNLQRSRLVDQLLCQLPIDDALYRWTNSSQAHPHLKALLGFIQTFKRSGLSPEQFRAIIAQNLDFMDFVSDRTDALALMATPLTGSAAAKIHLVERLEQAVATLPATGSATLPAAVRQPLPSTPGIYRPYRDYLVAAFAETELIDGETGKTTGLQELRKRLFVKTDDGRLDFKDRAVCHTALSAIKLYERYQNYLLEHDQYDFDDMILGATLAIESSPALQATLQDRYHYIQVDEYQDTNGSQMRLVELLTEGQEAPNILVVGDDDQAIMRFQGASVEYIHQFEQAYNGVKRVVLLTNYRSTAPLIELGQQLARQIEKRSAASATEKKLQAPPDRIDPPQSFVATHYASKELQYFALARALRRRIDDGFLDNSTHPGEEIAVISRTHEPLRALIPYLKQAEVAFNYSYTTTVSQIPSLQTLLVLLNFVAKQARAHPAYADARLPELLVAPQFGLSARDYLGFFFEFDRRHLSEGWLSALGASKNPRLRKLHAWLLELIEMALTGPVRTLIHKAAKPWFAYYREQAEDDPLTLVEFNYGVKALLDFVEGEVGGADRGLSSPALRLADITECFAEADRLGVVLDVSLPIKRERAITLTSAHSSKGLEYDLVYLMDADDGNWHRSGSGTPLLTGNMLFGTDKDADDARRLLFVALTRARSELELITGPGGIVRELLDLPEGMLIEREGELTVEEIALQAERSWEDSYRLDTAELQALARPDIEKMKMSSSRLNQFVDY